MRLILTSVFAAAVSAQYPLPLCLSFKAGTRPSNILDAIIGDEVFFDKTEGDEIVAFAKEKQWNACNMAKATTVPESTGGSFRAELLNPGMLYLASKQGCAQGTKMKLFTENCGDHAHNPRCYGGDGYHSADHSTTSDSSAPEVTHPMICSDDEQEEAVAAPATAECPACEACPTCECGGEEATGAPSKPRVGAPARRRKNALTIVWAAPKTNFQQGVDTYTVSYKQGKLPAQEVQLDDNTDTTAVVSGLANNKLYTFTVIANNNMGASKPLKFKAKTRK